MINVLQLFCNLGWRSQSVKKTRCVMKWRTDKNRQSNSSAIIGILMSSVGNFKISRETHAIVPVAAKEPSHLRIKQSIHSDNGPRPFNKRRVLVTREWILVQKFYLLSTFDDNYAVPGGSRRRQQERENDIRDKRCCIVYWVIKFI